MTIEFKKIPVGGTCFDIVLEKIRFFGEAKQVNKHLVQCNGTLQGVVPYHCDRCAELFDLKVDEKVEVFAHEGFYKDKEGEPLLNIVEFFDGYIDFTVLCESELEAFKSDYHYCGNCQNLEKDIL